MSSSRRSVSWSSRSSGPSKTPIESVNRSRRLAAACGSLAGPETACGGPAGAACGSWPPGGSLRTTVGGSMRLDAGLDRSLLEPALDRLQAIAHRLGEPRLGLTERRDLDVAEDV